jgi:hypothetical protein
MKFSKVVITALAALITIMVTLAPAAVAAPMTTVGTNVVVQNVPLNAVQSPCEPIKTDRCQDPATVPRPLQNQQAQPAAGWWASGWFVALCIVGAAVVVLGIAAVCSGPPEPEL